MAESYKVRGHDEPPLLFISQDSITLRRENLRAIVSHARKTQTKQKHKHKRVSAQYDATYARSLVGWRMDGADETKTTLQCLEPCLSLPKFQNDHHHDQARKPPPMSESKAAPRVPPSIGMTVRGGLRRDPFGCLPLDNNSKEATQMIDFCTHATRRQPDSEPTD